MEELVTGLSPGSTATPDFSQGFNLYHSSRNMWQISNIDGP